MDKTAKLRLFFGLEIPQAIKQRLLQIQQPVAGARWQRADQLHLTLAFLGSVDAGRLPVVCDAARNLPVEPFELTVCGIGCFGAPDRPKNLWAGVQPKEDLVRLHCALDQGLAQSGLAGERRRFHPHITLSRFKKGAGPVTELLQSPEQLVVGSFAVDRFALFQSVRGEQGSVYQIIERFTMMDQGKIDSADG
ncbi:RNA 2',3'-cyclic phosphodiesterase [Marinobacter sp. HL-58]|uniref:RNA 2',3'-cyclic phosphodiesterase n=1 Tax=Marinobacter sp. HL-58 TaxID=1479237 RepID=UPI000481C809|nr:RNA 2',3'-cyclic phosphodiesterase [Marinobacter sp. HL-58]KPP98019.1 MAG: 2'-5' RNA ligase [Marinobacter sp. HL-58]